MENFKTFIKKVFEYRKFILWKTKKFYNYRIYLPYLRTNSKVKTAISQPVGPYDFVIVDDFLPNILSAFRACEFEYLLKNIDNSALFSIVSTKIHPYKIYWDYHIKSPAHFKECKDEFSKVYNVSPDQIQPFYTWTKINTRLAYVIFLSNAIYLIDYFEKYNIRFVLGLHPGGGFSMDPEVHGNLTRVLNSPMFTKVHVTTKLTYRFLLDNKYCSEDKIAFKYGGILSTTFMGIPAKTIKYPDNKNTIDICFTAAKYMEKGIDKGYDLFIETAHMLLREDKKYHFHIVGNYTEDDIEIDPALRHHFHFYGLLKTSEFIKYYEDKDIFVSPNRPFILGKGAFDGFPTASAAEAGMNNLCLVVSDSLDQNVVYTNNVDIVLIETNAEDIFEKITDLAKDPAKMYEIGEAGKQLINADQKTQLPFRLSIIKSILND